LIFGSFGGLIVVVMVFLFFLGLLVSTARAQAPLHAAGAHSTFAAGAHFHAAAAVVHLALRAAIQAVAAIGFFAGGAELPTLVAQFAAAPLAAVGVVGGH
jgi:hypothetical protein